MFINLPLRNFAFWKTFIEVIVMSGPADPEETKRKLLMMLSNGVFPNPDGTMTRLSPEVAGQMMKDVKAGGAPLTSDDGLDYDTLEAPNGP